MAMSTSSAAALTTAQRKLKNLASDAIKIPSAAEIYKRKVAEIADAKAKLAAIVAKQIQIEEGKSRSTGDTATLLAEKRELKAKLGRLSDEAATLKWQFAPKPKLSPQQQFLSDALQFDDVYADRPRGTSEQIDQAKEEVADALRAYKLGDAGADVSKKLNAARLRLFALEGLPYSPKALQLFSRETLAAARKAEGLE